jgi:hypothetical protein
MSLRIETLQNTLKFTPAAFQSSSAGKRSVVAMSTVRATKKAGATS